MKPHLAASAILLSLGFFGTAHAWPPSSTLPKEQNIILRCGVSDTLTAKDCALPIALPAGQSNPAMQAFVQRAQAFIQVETATPDYLAGAKPGDRMLVLIRRSTAAPLDGENPGRASPPATPGAAISDPDWAKMPGQSDINGYFPERAQRLNVSGSAVAQCTVGGAGDLLGCWIASQSPPDANFGDALLKLSTTIQMKPATKGGARTAGRPYILQAKFADGRITLSTAAP